MIHHDEDDGMMIYHDKDDGMMIHHDENDGVTLSSAVHSHLAVIFMQ
jgi:hypothetical protein